MIKLIFMYTRPKLTISTKKKKFKKNCLKKVCKLGILGHSDLFQDLKYYSRLSRFFSSPFITATEKKPTLQN